MSPRSATIGRRLPEGGYTLIELLVVLAILGLLATIATTQVLRYFEHAKVNTAHAQVDSFSSALELYKLDVGGYPTSQEGLVALIRKPASAADTWNGPYVKNTTSLNDPWGRPYKYVSPGQHGEFDLSSGGPGGDASGADPPVRNW